MMKPDWFTEAEEYLVKIAALLSVGMLLAWSLWREFRRLFLNKSRLKRNGNQGHLGNE